MPATDTAWFYSKKEDDCYQILWLGNLSITSFTTVIVWGLKQQTIDAMHWNIFIVYIYLLEYFICALHWLSYESCDNQITDAIDKYALQYTYSLDI